MCRTCNARKNACSARTWIHEWRVYVRRDARAQKRTVTTCTTNSSSAATAKIATNGTAVPWLLILAVRLAYLRSGGSLWPTFSVLLCDARCRITRTCIDRSVREIHLRFCALKMFLCEIALVLRNPCLSYIINGGRNSHLNSVFCFNKILFNNLFLFIKIIR